MRAILSILIATLVGSVLLQGYISVWHPSSFGRFSEFPVIMVYAAGIISTAFLLLIVSDLCLTAARATQTVLASWFHHWFSARLRGHAFVYGTVPLASSHCRVSRWQCRRSDRGRDVCRAHIQICQERLKRLAISVCVSTQGALIRH